jgi:hypothetical protein
MALGSTQPLTQMGKGNGKAIPLQAWTGLRVPGGWGSQILRQSAYEGGKVVSPTHRPPLPQKIFLVLISVGGSVDTRVIVRPEGFMSMKNSTIGNRTRDHPQFVAQCLNQLRHRVPPQKWVPGMFPGVRAGSAQSWQPSCADRFERSESQPRVTLRAGQGLLYIFSILGSEPASQLRVVTKNSFSYRNLPGFQGVRFEVTGPCSA